MDTEYILGCSLELAETTAVEYAVLSDKQGAYDVIRQLVDADLAVSPEFMVNTARKALNDATPELRYRFALLALPMLRASLARWQERMSFVVQRQLQEDLGVREVLKLDDNLASRTGAVQPHRVSARFVQHEAEVSEACVQQVLEHHFGFAIQRLSEDVRLIQEALAWVAREGCAGWQKLGLSPAAVKTSTLQDGTKRVIDAAALSAWVRQEKQRQQTKRQAQERSLFTRAQSAIKKATKLFEQMGFRQELNLFVSGKEVELSRPGAALKLVVKPLAVDGWLVDRTLVGRSHTPYELQVLTASNVHVANLCVYFQDTPVLDQLLALSLFVQSGQELELLEKANWFSCADTPLAVREEVSKLYPSLREKFPQQRPKESSGVAPKIVLPALFEQEERHWEPFKGRVEQWIATWLSPIRERALGFEPASELVRLAVSAMELDGRNAGRSRSETVVVESPAAQGLAA